jgi:hypothetical protein
MMKKILFCLLVMASVKVSAQNLVLTKAANEPVISDSVKTYIIDTSAYQSGLFVSVTGANTYWNYTYLAATGTVINAVYVSTTTVPGSSNYPGCTLVQKQGALNTFYKSVTSPSTQLEFMGIGSPSLNMNFTNTAVMAKYPFAFGNSFTDSFSGSFTFSISGTASGNATVTADGTGTLALPSTTLNNVLRVKTAQNTNFYSGIFPVGSFKQTIYSFYHASQKFPILNISYETLTLSGQSPSVTALVTGNRNNFVVGIAENNWVDMNASLYPNPADGVLHVFVEPILAPQTIEIYNELGGLVLRTAYESKIDLTHLQHGLYLVSIRTSAGFIHKKFIKEKH